MAYNFIDECPSCGSKLDMDDWRCINPNCPAQIENHILNFVGKNALDIDGLGRANVRKLIESGLVGNIADLYTLEREKLIDIGFGPKETENLLEAIERSKAAPPERILTGLGIEGVGLTMAEKIISKAGSIEALQNTPIEMISCRVSESVSKRIKNVRTVFEQLESETDILVLLTKITGVDEKLANRLIEVTDGSLELLRNTSLEKLNDWVTNSKALHNVYEFFSLLLKLEESHVGEGIRNVRVAFDEINKNNECDLKKLLCMIVGVGETYSKRISKAAGSLDKLKNASYDEIINWGIHPGLKNIRRFFDLLKAVDDEENAVELLTLIKGMDREKAQLLIDRIGSIEEIKKASEEDLNTWLNDTKIVARHVREFFDLEENKILLERLKVMGLNVGDKNVDQKDEVKSKAGGETIVFTGTLTITRAKAGEMAQAAGFTVKNTITTGTKYLVVGEKSGSKLQKAEALGITILDEQQFYELIGANN